MSNLLSEEDKTKIFYAIQSSLYNFLVMNVKRPKNFEKWCTTLAERLKDIPDEMFHEVIFNQSMKLASDMANNYIFKVMGSDEYWSLMEPKAKEMFNHMPPPTEHMH